MTLLAVLVGGGAVLAAPALPSHSWGNYHWARTANPFTLRFIDANSSYWDSAPDEGPAAPPSPG